MHLAWRKDHPDLKSLPYPMLADTKRSQVVVPAVAVQHGPQSTFVYTIKDGKAVVRPVTVGLVDGDRAIILSGLDAGEQVVTDSTDRAP